MQQDGTSSGEAFPVGHLQPVGEFSYDRRHQRWHWSEEMYRLHGFEPGEVVPTTELVLRHKEPGAGKVAGDEVRAAIDSGAPHSFWHRILDAKGRSRSVVTVWKGHKDPSGEVVELRGFMMDVTTGVRRDASSAVSAAFEHRAVIDQAKGMLMLVHGIGADEAFALLHTASTRTNTKLHDVAARLVESFSGDPVDLRHQDLRDRVAQAMFGPCDASGETA